MTKQKAKQVILTALRERFPDCQFRDGEEFDGDPDCIAWSGEGSTIVVDGVEWEAFDTYADNSAYDMGVHREMYRFAEERGFFWEAYDCGTFLMYAD